MSPPTFIHLNLDWNAEPNAPDLKIEAKGSTMCLSFYLNSFAYEAVEGEVGLLTFHDCSRWRWDATNDHAWFAGEGRYAGVAPTWGEFYEVLDDEPLMEGRDWEVISTGSEKDRHFLFYFRDETIECMASNWTLERKEGGGAMTALGSSAP
jgi:hypothetical protein